ncbi:RNA pseudouridylate synthase domain-containing protein 4 isoform X3 [Numida meleagris]|uniref:RNA pseudouridylate synthase domain-containing protein 4 isoform X3 n=1 Tax=Numida meleagris TaxID=8996 RepID=UPI000B3E1434|nr:RNA pseudouridylate synthase domain-containing protein 4 isoform X3 [Numida meleagris]
MADSAVTRLPPPFPLDAGLRHRLRVGGRGGAQEGQQNGGAQETPVGAAGRDLGADGDGGGAGGGAGGAAAGEAERGGEAARGGPGVKNCIADVLPILAKMLVNMKAEPLHLCHRLDKETTGVMVLARSKEAADRIRLLFKTRQVEKIYWAVSVGHPDPAEGIVEIPMVEREVQSHQPHYKMTLAPNYRMSPEDGKVLKIRKNRSAESAVTQYRVLASSSACSLLELQPITGVKHQLRVHLAYGLGCPILGDHKYSHWSKLAPQKLPEITLKRLKLQQSKARHLPLHLHAYRLSLPLGTSGSKQIDLVCEPPSFFHRTLRKLELDIDKE